MNKDTRNLLIVGGLLAAFASVGTGVYMATRGIRNNNPGNIRRTSDQWRGLAADQTDPEYFVFKEPVWGIRAMARLLQNYQSRYGLNSVRDIISRWAPPSENPTQNYIDYVAGKLNVNPDAAINTADPATAAPLIKSIIEFENGKNPYSHDVILKGIELA